MFTSLLQEIKVPQIVRVYLHAFQVASRLDLEKNTNAQLITHVDIFPEDPDPYCVQRWFLVRIIIFDDKN